MRSERKGQAFWAERIVRDPRICGGQAVIKGTRVILRTVARQPRGWRFCRGDPQGFPQPNAGGHAGGDCLCRGFSGRGPSCARHSPDLMKIKLDENLPGRLAARLASLGHDVQTVREEGLEGHLDETIWEVAQSEGRFLITQDLDFSDARRFAPGSHYGILLIRLRTPKRLAINRDALRISVRARGCMSQWATMLWSVATESEDPGAHDRRSLRDA